MPKQEQLEHLCPLATGWHAVQVVSQPLPKLSILNVCSLQVTTNGHTPILPLMIEGTLKVLIATLSRFFLVVYSAFSFPAVMI